MRLNKNSRIFINYFLGPVLFLWLCFSIYTQLQSQSQLGASWQHIKSSFTSTGVWYLVMAVGLVFLNWGLEAAKWQLCVKDVHPLNFPQAFKAVLTGVSVSVAMPNRVGEYLGRMMYMPEGKRLKVISVSIISGISQLLVTIVSGLVGLLVLKQKLIAAGLLGLVSYQFVLVGLFTGAIILTALYFNFPAFERWIKKVTKRRWWLYLIEAIGYFTTQRLLLLLLLSFCRYIVFVIQYVLLFRLFDVEVPVVTLAWVMSLVFLALAVIPTLAVVVEFGVRSEVCLALVGLFSVNTLGIVFTSVTAWFINLIIPALMGSLLILSIKVFKRREGIEPISENKHYIDETV